jgi:hypothetical protein
VKTLRELYSEPLFEPIPDEMTELLAKLSEDSVCSQPTNCAPFTNGTTATPNGQPTN